MGHESNRDLREIEIRKIQAAKRQLAKSITSTMNDKKGGITVFGTEKSYELQQSEIEDVVNPQTAKNVFELDLEHGAYHVDYTRNGQYLALCGQRGHLSIIRWKDHRLISEQYLNAKREWVHDAIFAGNESMLCVAQREGL